VYYFFEREGVQKLPYQKNKASGELAGGEVRQVKVNKYNTNTIHIKGRV